MGKVKNHALPPEIDAVLRGFFYAQMKERTINSRMELVHLDTKPEMTCIVISAIVPSDVVEKISAEAYGALTEELRLYFGNSVSVMPGPLATA